MAFGRGAFGRTAFGRSAAGSTSILVTPTAGVVAIVSGQVRAAIDVASAPATLVTVAGSVRALLSSSASGRIAYHGESVRAGITLNPDATSYAVVKGGVQALLSSSASGRIAYQSSTVSAAIVARPEAGRLAVISGAPHAALNVTPVSASIVVRSGSNIAAGIPGNFTPAYQAIVGGKLHATITAVPGERYRNLRSRAFGRTVFGRLTETTRTFMASSTVVIQPALVVPNITLHPQAGQIVWQAAAVRGSVTIRPASASLAIVAGRFPMRARTAVFTLD